MERGSRRPDAPPVAHAAIRAAVEEASRQLPGVALVAGGKSFGGRMTSQAQALAQATVRAAVAAAGRLAPDLPLIAGGKSFGGRMTSQAQAAAPLPAVRGLAFLGFPLHPAGRPGDARAAHLAEVQLPMLFLQGTRDALADLSRLQGVIGRLGPRATLCRFEGADHSFHVPARSGRTDADVLQALLDALVGWIDAQARGIDTAHDDNGRSS
jgi:predicted alpha/beta-hydrolase family hydrolase